MQQLSYWSEIKQRDEQCRHLILCLVFKMTKLICMQALVQSANRYRYEPINWNRLSIPDAVLVYSPTSFGLCQRTHGTGLSSMQQLAEPLFILHCVFLHCMNEIESVVEDSYPAKLITLVQKPWRTELRKRLIASAFLLQQIKAAWHPSQIPCDSSIGSRWENRTPIKGLWFLCSSH